MLGYATTLEYAEQVLAQELNKTEGQRNADLIQECMQTIEETSRDADALMAAHGRRRPLLRWTRARRIAAMCIAAILVLLLASGVAQALGFRVWSALLQWDNDLLSIHYVPEDYIPPPDGPVEEGNPIVNEGGDGFVDALYFATMEEALTATGLSPRFPAPPEGFTLTSVTGWIIDSGNQLDFTYTGEDGTFVSVYIMAIMEGNATWSFFVPNATASEERTINGISYTIVISESLIFISWEHNGLAYGMDTTLPYDAVIEMLNAS